MVNCRRIGQELVIGGFVPGAHDFDSHHCWLLPRQGAGLHRPSSERIRATKGHDCPECPELHQNSAVEKVAQLIEKAGIQLMEASRFEILTTCLSSRW